MRTVTTVHWKAELAQSYSSQPRISRWLPEGGAEGTCREYNNEIVQDRLTGAVPRGAVPEALARMLPRVVGFDAYRSNMPNVYWHGSREQRSMITRTRYQPERSGTSLTTG